ANAAIHKTSDLIFGEIMVIDVAEGEIDVRAEIFERTFKTLGHCDGADRADECAAQALEHHSFAGVNVLEIERAMRALDDLRRAIVTADARDQLVVRLAAVLGNENVTRASQIPWRLAQRSARKQKFVSERRLSIDQNDIEAMFKMEILQTI